MEGKNEIFGSGSLLRRGEEAYPPASPFSGAGTEIKAGALD